MTVEVLPTGYLPARESTLDIAADAWGLAQKVAGTNFVPAPLRGDPYAVLAAMLTGHELGLSPMTSLAKIHVIEGRPGIAAELMRALILQHGHEFTVAEMTNTRCVVVGRRAGEEARLSITWTMDDAKTAGLQSKNNWRNYPRAMLLARATSELARAKFPDVIAGLYSVEELQDGWEGFEPPTSDALEVAAPTPARRTARAKRAATSAPAPAEQPSEPPPVAERPPLPGEESGSTLVTPAPQTPQASPAVDSVESTSPLSMTADDGVPSIEAPAASSPATSEGGAEHFPPDVPAPPDDELRSRLLDPSEGELIAGTDEPPEPSGATVPLHVMLIREIAEIVPGDEFRHNFLSTFSGGRYSSSRDVPQEDVARLRATIVRNKRAGAQPADYEPLTLDIWDEARWRATLDNVPGVGVAKLLKAARTIAEERGLPVPQDVSGITDETLVIAVLTWLREQATT